MLILYVCWGIECLTVLIDTTHRLTLRSVKRIEKKDAITVAFTVQNDCFSFDEV